MSAILKHRRISNDLELITKGINENNNSSSREEKLKHRRCPSVESWRCYFFFFAVIICIIFVPQIFISNKNDDPSIQCESMAKIYMNRFAISEEDQFEIHVKDYPDTDFYNFGEEEMYNAAEEVILKAQQGRVIIV